MSTTTTQPAPFTRGRAPITLQPEDIKRRCPDCRITWPATRDYFAHEPKAVRGHRARELCRACQKAHEHAA